MTSKETAVATTVRVRFGETDAAGIVYYPTFFTWFSLGTDALLRKDGETLRDAEGGPLWPLPTVNCGATFSAPLFYDDEIVVRSTVAEIGSRSFKVEHVISRNEREVARGFEVRVYVRRDANRLSAVPLPDDLRARLTKAHTPK